LALKNEILQLWNFLRFGGAEIEEEYEEGETEKESLDI
jgi:hypothetical protein